MGSLRPTGGRAGWDCYAIPAAEGWECYALLAAEGWKCYALPAAGWDGIATSYRRRRDGNVMPYRRQGGMGSLRPTGWECYALLAAEGWKCNALTAAGWDGIATSYGLGMLCRTGGMVGWECYALAAAG